MGRREAAVLFPLSSQPRLARLGKLGFTPIIEFYLGTHLKVAKNGVFAEVVSKRRKVGCSGFDLTGFKSLTRRRERLEVLNDLCAQYRVFSGNAGRG